MNILNIPNAQYIDHNADIKKLADAYCSGQIIEPDLYKKFNVNRGLRDQNGNGVITGLTEISEVNGFKYVDDVKTPCDGELYYRGVNIQELTAGFMSEKRFGFEETAFLLMFGKLPGKKELKDFEALLADYRRLPQNFVKDVILNAPTADMMNSLTKSVISLSGYDEMANCNDIPNVLRQTLQLIAVFPLLATYGYQAYSHYILDQSLIIHNPDPTLSTAENILRMLRPDGKYTMSEAHMLDLALVLHAEHGGGNNSTFTTHVVTSSGTDTYSTMAAALCSLKGPRHGGANIKVVQMFNDLKRKVKDWNDDDEIAAYLNSLLNKQAFDKAGLIYGIGHAVYTRSDPRAVILRKFVSALSAEKGREDEYRLYKAVERIAPQLISGQRTMYKGVSANVDFYSGLVYDMLGLPLELFTPMFAVSRIVGWSAHRMEELLNQGKIIRPAYISVSKRNSYCPLTER